MEIMKLSLNKIKEKISAVAYELREDAEHNGAFGDNGAAKLESELAMFIAGFNACQEAVLFEIKHIVEPTVEITIPDSWRKYFIEEEKEYQEYLRLKEKFENGK